MMRESLSTYVFAGGKGTRMGFSASQSKLLLPLRADGVAVPLVVVVVRQLFLDGTRTVLVAGHAADMVETAVQGWCPCVEFLRLPWSDDPSRCIRTVGVPDRGPQGSPRLTRFSLRTSSRQEGRSISRVFHGFRS